MNPYEILGISHNANEEEIKKSYRKLARQYHPDRNPGDIEAETKFKEIQEAYEKLTNKNPSTFNLNDIFNDFFYRKPKKTRGRDIHAMCEVTFIEAAKGCETIVNLRCGEQCLICKGEGATSFSSCTLCKGQGSTTYQQGNMTVKSTCRNCFGTGKIITNVCKECNGDGITKETIPIKIKLPQGIRDGEQLRLENQGEKRGDIPGDAYITIHVLPHPIFVRKQDDLIINIPITFSQAVLGDTVKIPTLDGIKQINIPEYTKDGDEIRLIEMGLINPKTGRRGDCIIYFKIETYIQSIEAKELIIKLKKFDDLNLSDTRENFSKYVQSLTNIN